jgi:hypothetical protein
LQLVSSLQSVAEALRHAAVVAEQFANVFKLPQEATVAKTALDPQLRGSKEHQHAKRKADELDDNDADDDTAKNAQRKMRIRKPRDPNAPKRPASSYLMFQNQMRKELKAKHPNLSNTELLASISKLWSDLPEEKKVVSSFVFFFFCLNMSIAYRLLKVFNAAQAEAKKKYAAEKAAYDAINAPLPQDKVAPVR